MKWEIMKKHISKMDNKYLFVFNCKLSGISAEVFARDFDDAQRKVCKLMGISKISAPVYMTENYDCPRCRIVESGD